MNTLLEKITSHVWNEDLAEMTVVGTVAQGSKKSVVAVECDVRPSIETLYIFPTIAYAVDKVVRVSESLYHLFISCDDDRVGGE